jgi:hypothetical protein
VSLNIFLLSGIKGRIKIDLCNLYILVANRKRSLRIELEDRIELIGHDLTTPPEVPETILIRIDSDRDFLEMDIASIDFGAVFPLKAISVIEESENGSGRDVLVLNHSELRFERRDFSEEIVVSFNKRRMNIGSYRHKKSRKK